MRLFKIYLIFLISLLFLALGSNFALAGIFSTDQQGKILGNISTTSGPLGLTAGSPAAIAAAIATALLSVVGAVFMIMIIYGGVRWMTAGGSEDKIKKAKNLIANTVIAGAIVLTASSISYIVITAIEKGSGTATPPVSPTTTTQCTHRDCVQTGCETIRDEDACNRKSDCCIFRNMPWPTPNRCDLLYPECENATFTN